MASAHQLGTIHGVRPGARVTPEPPRAELAAERRTRQRRADTVARRTNPAYGTLNLDQWGEHMINANSPIPPPTGRPKRARP